MADKRRVEKQQYAVADISKRLEAPTSGGGGSVIRMPKGVYPFDPKNEGEYTLDILPWTTTDRLKKLIPQKTRFCPPGTLYYEQTYFQHWGVGGRTVICSANVFKGGRCPVCEFRQKGFADPERDDDMTKLLKSLGDKERQLYLVWDHDNKKKGVGLWDVSAHLFGVNLIGAMNATRDPAKAAARRLFFHPAKGMTLTLVAKEKSISGGKPFLEFPSIVFEPRAEPVPKDVLAKAMAIDLSACFAQPDYAELRKVFLTGMGGKGKAADDEPEDEEEDAGGEDDDATAEDDGEEDGGAEDAESDDEEGVGEGDEEADEEVAEDEEDAAEDDEPAVSAGDVVKFEYKGKKYRGKVTKLKTSKVSGKPLAVVRVKDREEPMAVLVEDLTVVADEGTKPAPKKPGAKKPKAEEEDEFEAEFGGIADDEGDEEEEPAPKKKPKPGKKPVAAGKKPGKKPKADEDEDEFDSDTAW